MEGEQLAWTEPQLTDSGGRPRPLLSLDPAPLAPGQVIVIPRRMMSRFPIESTRGSYSSTVGALSYPS